MFQLDAPAASAAARRARFDAFRDAAACAVAHARQHGEAQVRYRSSGLLVADFVRNDDRTVSVFAAGADGRALVEGWAS